LIYAIYDYSHSLIIADVSTLLFRTSPDAPMIAERYASIMSVEIPLEDPPSIADAQILMPTAAALR